MSYGELTQEERADIEKVRALENATLFKTAAEVAELYKELGEVEVSACALGYACRYKGLEHVRALVENGASFKVENSTDMYRKYQCLGTNYAVGLLDFNKALGRSYFIHNGELDMRITNLLNADNGTANLVLPLAERLEILRYLYENRERVCLETDELLFFALIARNKEVVAELKRLGVTLTEKIIKTLTESRRSFMWDEYCGMVGGFEREELFGFYEDIFAEIGEGTRLRYTEGIYYATLRRFPETDVFEFLMEHFDCAKMNKTQILKDFVLKEKVDCLAAAEKYGWLSQPRRRDELIKYASEHEKTEATAWLLDFKNRTADLATEQEKAEKKMMRELNASPNSVTELKKLWSYKKQEDGTLVITSYKGDKTEVTVPERIGKSVVTAIGEYAFSPYAPHLSSEMGKKRAAITKITLPDSIMEIGASAFSWCKALEEINIPDGVKCLSSNMLDGCAALKAIKIPDTVERICESAFSGCKSIERIDIPDSVTEVMSGAFGGCRTIKEMVLPSSVKELGRNVFIGCSALKHIVLPDGITEIGDNMFGVCSVLEAIDIPASVTKIGQWAFQNCKSLKSVVIPDGVEEIGKLAFVQCISLESLELPASVRRIKNVPTGNGSETFVYKSDNVTVIVPPKSYAEKYCKRNNLKYQYKENL